MEEERTFGWRELLGHVNLRDFSHMVGGEVAMIGGSLQRAVQVVPHLPLGPFISIALVLLAILRSALLIVVVVVFGISITTISAVRALSRMFRRGAAS